MPEFVLDASALLIWLFREPGLEHVDALLRDHEVAVSAVNISETVATLLDRHVVEADAAIQAMELTIIPFDETRALAAASLRPITRHAGLSLGDRACLALARELNVPAVTADRSWLQVDLGVEVQFARANG